MKNITSKDIFYALVLFICVITYCFLTRFEMYIDNKSNVYKINRITGKIFVYPLSVGVSQWILLENKTNIENNNNK